MVHKECSPVQQKIMIFILTFNFFMFFLLNKVNWETTAKHWRMFCHAPSFLTMQRHLLSIDWTTEKTRNLRGYKNVFINIKVKLRI